jgi:hypothetical protein
MSEIQFIPECNADTALLLALGIPDSYINKADNNSKIAKSMISQSRHYHKRLIGLTDLDKKNIPSYFGQFEEIRSGHDIFYKKKSDCQHFLIFLKPAVEKWLLKAASKVDISISDFGFQSDVKVLKNETTHIKIRDDKNFRNFILAIKNAESPAMKFLTDIIKEHYEL